MYERLVRSLVLVGLVLVLGTVGYTLIEGWSLLDALYMTVITVATVGFGEVGELGEGGRVFTIVLILSGTSAILFSLGTFVDFLVEGHLRGILEGRRMQKSIEALSGHHIVAGIGRVGSEVGRALADRGEPFVVVEKSEDALEEAIGEGWLSIHGDASQEEVLVRAGISRARSLVTALDTDADNLFVTLTGRTLNPDLFIVARTSKESSEEKLLRAGADRVITPNIISGRRMASMVVSPVISDYLDLVTHGGGIEFRLEEIKVGSDAPYSGRTLNEARVRDVIGVLVLAVHHADGSVDTNPTSDTMMNPGDSLIVLGTPTQLADMVRNTCDVG